MIHQSVPATPEIAPSILLNRHASVASAALTPDAPALPRPDLDDIGAAATAMAWAMQGRLMQARFTLRRLTPVMQHEVAEVAWRLAVLAAGMSAVGEDTQPLPIVPAGVEAYPIGGEGR